MLRWTLPLVLAGLLAGCNDDTDPSSNGDAADIVVVVPLTGTFATKGLLHQNAVIMAMQHLQDAGFTSKTGIAMSITPVDSGPGETAAERVANVQTRLQEIIDAKTMDDGNVGITGIISSTGDAHQGAAPMSATYGIPFFEASDGAGEDEFMVHQSDEHPDGYTDDQLSYLFGTRPLCDPEAVLTAKLIKEMWDGKRLAIFQGLSTHDQMHSDTLRAELTAIGFTGTIVDSGDAAHGGDYVLEYTDTSFQDNIEGAIAGTDPEVIFFHLGGDSHNLRFLQDAKAAGFEGAIPTCGMARGTWLIDNAQNGGISEYLTGRLFFAMRGPEPSDSLTTFKTDFETMYAADQLKSDNFTPMMYDAAQMLMLSVATSGAPYDHEAIRDAMFPISQTGTAIEYGGLASGIDAILAGTDVDLNGVSSDLTMREADRTIPGSFYVEEVLDNGDGTFKYNEILSPPRATY